MNPTLVYIAGPYGSPHEHERLANVGRACHLSLWASRAGYAPIVVHPAIHWGAYGSDDNPADRERGLATVTAILRAAAQAGGHLWVILRDDGSMSSGTEREVLAWEEETAGGDPRTLALTWPQWLHAALDELGADFLAHTGGRPSNATILERLDRGPR